MSVVSGLFPYDPANLATGPARILWAQQSVTEPTSPADIFAQVSPYAPQTGWNDFGATDAAAVYARNLQTQDLRIEQTTAVVLEEITGLDRTLTVPAVEVDIPALQIFEQTNSASSAVAAAAGHSAFTKQQIGTITTLQRYRLAFVIQRDISSGIVNEPTGGITRGRFLVFSAYTCAISAENSQISMARNAFAAIPMSFRFFPQGGKPAGQETGAYFDEAAGTIA